MHHIDHRRIERLAYHESSALRTSFGKSEEGPLGPLFRIGFAPRAELQLQHPISELRLFGLAMGPTEQ
jgi:hypothetical protein